MHQLCINHLQDISINIKTTSITPHVQSCLMQSFWAKRKLEAQLNRQICLYHSFRLISFNLFQYVQLYNEEKELQKIVHSHRKICQRQHFIQLHTSQRVFLFEDFTWHVANKVYSLTIPINSCPLPVLGHNPFLVIVKLPGQGADCTIQVQELTV